MPQINWSNRMHNLQWLTKSQTLLNDWTELNWTVTYVIACILRFRTYFFFSWQAALYLFLSTIHYLSELCKCHTKAKCWEFNMQREYLLVLNTNSILTCPWKIGIVASLIWGLKKNYGTFYNLCVMDRII